MKKILFSLALLIATDSFAAGTTQWNPKQNKIAPIQAGSGVGAAPVGTGYPNSAGVMQQPVMILEQIAWSVTPTMITGSNTISGGSLSNTDWIDTSAYNDLVLETNFNLGCATVIVESVITYTITGVPVNPPASSIVISNRIVGVTSTANPTQTHITYLGKYTRIRVEANTGANAGGANGLKDSATVSIGAIFRKTN